MGSTSKNPDDYRDPPTPPLSVILRRFAWGVLAIAVLIALYGCLAAFFAGQLHYADEVDRQEAFARRVFVVSGVVVAFSAALGACGAIARSREG